MEPSAATPAPSASPGTEPARAFAAWARWFWPAALGCLVLDQASKWWLQAQVLGSDAAFHHGPFPAGYPSWLEWHLNPGIGFSILRGHPGVVTLLTVVLVPVLMWIWWRQFRQLGGWENTAFGLVLGGAVGNAIDRLLAQAGVMGGVRDFINVDLGFWPLNPWPTFNIADAGLSVGFVLIILMSFRRPVPAPGAPSPARPAPSADALRQTTES